MRKPYHEHEIFEVMARHLGLSYIYEEERAPSTPQKELTPAQPTSDLPQKLWDQLHWTALRLV